MKLSIIVKARNEAADIAKCIESALAAVQCVGGEVVLADGCSTDATIEIAKAYPIRIVQLAVPSQACCGIGPELGFQHANGEFIYLLDGDMVVDPEFVESAIRLLEKDETLAGVGGYIREMRASNFEFKRRSQRLETLKAAGARETESLSGGGLYRRAALVDVGYMSDRNLHALEEYDLGTRLRKSGWRLIALPERSADHYSYDLGTFELLRHRIRGGNFLSQGELLRAAWESGYLGQALSELRAFRFSFAVIAYWGAALLLAIILQRPLTILAAAFVGTLVAGGLLSTIRRDVTSGFHSILIWHLTAGGLILGALRPRRNPRSAIEFRSIAEGQEHAAPSVPARLDAMAPQG